MLLHKLHMYMYLGTVGYEYLRRRSGATSSRGAGGPRARAAPGAV